jgi:glycosyltransferase involved in cell wall biosynthesis
MFEGSVIHGTKSIGREAFGVATVATKLPQAQADLGMDPEVWVMNTPKEASEASAANGLEPSLVRTFPQSQPAFLGISFDMEKAARSWAGRQPLVVHQHMLWLGYSRTTDLFRSKKGARTVIAPHGVLDYWHVRKSKLKKAVAGFLYEHSNLRNCACLQATSDQELKDFRNFGLKNPIARINNGVSEHQLGCRGNGGNFRSKHGLDAGRRIMLFVSRISRQKGLDMLLRAMDRLRKESADWTLAIAGYDQEGYEPEVRRLIADLKMDERVIFVGPLYGEEKDDAFAAAEVFVLPSRSEGSPMIVLEAMAAGLPIMTTQAAPWEELLKHDCGWWSEISTEGIEESLADVLTLDARYLSDKGECAKKLVAAEYTWSAAARRTSELYGWLTEGGTPPDFVLCD